MISIEKCYTTEKERLCFQVSVVQKDCETMITVSAKAQRCENSCFAKEKVSGFMVLKNYTSWVVQSGKCYLKDSIAPYYKVI